MTCEKCEALQELAFNKNVPDTAPIVYVRVGVSNVAVVACEEHAKMLLEKYNRR